MIVHTLPCFVHILTASVGKLSEVSCPVMESLVIVTFGLMISVLEAAQCIMEVRTVPLLASVKHTAVATFREAAALDSGVSGIGVMVR